MRVAGTRRMSESRRNQKSAHTFVNLSNRKQHSYHVLQGYYFLRALRDLCLANSAIKAVDRRERRGFAEIARKLASRIPASRASNHNQLRRTEGPSQQHLR